MDRPWSLDNRSVQRLSNGQGDRFFQGERAVLYLEKDMKISKLMDFVAKKVFFAGRTEWTYVGDNDRLFVRRTSYAEFDVVEKIGVDVPESRFSEVWEPGALAVPSKWQSRLGDDIQWYIPKESRRIQILSNGFKKTDSDIKEIACELTEDAEIVVGERTSYWLQVSVEYHGEVMASETKHGEDFYVMPNDIDPRIDEVTSRILPDVVKAARMHVRYRTIAFAAA
jgi:hypothetical protein